MCVQTSPPTPIGWPELLPASREFDESLALHELLGCIGSHDPEMRGMSPAEYSRRTTLDSPAVAAAQSEATRTPEGEAPLKKTKSPAVPLPAQRGLVIGRVVTPAKPCSPPAKGQCSLVMSRTPPEAEAVPKLCAKKAAVGQPPALVEVAKAGGVELALKAPALNAVPKRVVEPPPPPKTPAVPKAVVEPPAAMAVVEPPAVPEGVVEPPEAVVEPPAVPKPVVEPPPAPKTTAVPKAVVEPPAVSEAVVALPDRVVEPPVPDAVVEPAPIAAPEPTPAPTCPKLEPKRPSCLRMPRVTFSDQLGVKREGQGNATPSKVVPSSSARAAAASAVRVTSQAPVSQSVARAL